MDAEVVMESIVSALGADRFEIVRRYAVAQAADPRREGGPQERDLVRLADEIADAVWHREFEHHAHRSVVRANSTEVERIGLHFRFYRTMPCYWLLARLNWEFKELSGDGRNAFWEEMRSILSLGDDGQAHWVQYFLWCNPFEQKDEVEDAWQRLVRDDSSDTLLRRALKCSGPVPYRLKEPLYARLVHDPKWHRSIFVSLCFSLQDVYGQIDAARAKRLLARLQISPEDSAELRKALDTYAEIGPTPTIRSDVSPPTIRHGRRRRRHGA